MNRAPRTLTSRVRRWIHPRRPLGVVWLDVFAVLATLLLVLVLAGFDHVYRRATDPRVPVELQVAPVSGPALRGELDGWRPVRCEFRNTGADTLWLEQEAGNVGYLDCLFVDGVRRKTRSLGCGTMLRRFPVPPCGILAFPASLRDSPHPHTLLLGLRADPHVRSRRYAAWTDTFTMGNSPRIVGLEWGNLDFE